MLFYCIVSNNCYVWFYLISEFSESLKELGGCLLEKTALNEDEESGKQMKISLCTLSLEVTFLTNNGLFFD